MLKQVIRSLRISLRSPKVPKPDAARDRETADRIVSDLSQGNIYLQQGRYSTEEDLALERDRVLNKNIL